MGDVIVWAAVWKAFAISLIAMVVVMFVVMFGLVGYAWLVTRPAHARLAALALVLLVALVVAAGWRVLGI